ncbi:hypothetical protein ABIA30_000602 [Mycobacterium sp. MAA66]|uniref:MmpS family transport accessory protein n=1 Tax=Mycobacterium sp. MAA66 TaxID=3156297 RepID=UPI0035120C43
MTWIARAVSRLWVLLTIVAVMTVGGLVIYRFQGIFGAQQVSANENRTDNIVSTIPKYVTYEVDGPPGASGMISYVDEKSQPREEHFDSLPWSHTLVTTVPSVFANLMVQGDSHALSCRIRVNGQLRDQQSTNAVDATTFCLVKAA